MTVYTLALDNIVGVCPIQSECKDTSIQQQDLYLCDCGHYACEACCYAINDGKGMQLLCDNCGPQEL